MAGALVGSEILKIAAEIRALMGQGVPVCNLTVGDFSPKQFPIPEVLQQAILRALERSETNYPAANGQVELRQAIAALLRAASWAALVRSTAFLSAAARAR